MWERNRERNEDLGSGGRQLKAAQCTNRQPPQLLPGNNTCREDGAMPLLKGYHALFGLM